MTKKVKIWFAGIVFLCSYLPAVYAVPIFSGDTYSVRLGVADVGFDNFTAYHDSAASGDTIVTFDGISEDLQAYRNDLDASKGLVVQVTESETTLPGDINEVVINVSANGDMFPVITDHPELNRATFSLGYNVDSALADPLNPSIIPYDLLMEVMVFKAGSEEKAKWESPDFVLDLNNPLTEPFGTTLYLQASPATVGVGIDSIEITLRFAEVPEPATLTLMGLGLAGIGFRRHRSKKAA